MEIVELILLLIACFIALSYRRDAIHYKEKCMDITIKYAMLRDLLDKKGIDINE